MKQSTINLAVQDYILHDRRIATEYKLQTGVNRTGIEILTFININELVTVYQIRKSLKHSNMQTIRRSVKVLVDVGLVECLKKGTGHSASFYVISIKGKQSYVHYLEQWGKITA